MKILVIGLGSMGQRHVRLLRDLNAWVAGSDADPAVCEAVSREYDILTHPAPEAIARSHKLDGVIVATPTLHHVAPAEWAMTVCRNILIEKPVTVLAEQAMRLQERAASFGTNVLIGYCLRFQDGLRQLKDILDSAIYGESLHARVWFGHWLPDWHPGQDYRQWYSCRKAEGGGILMDASHELDYACWLFGDPISVQANCNNTGCLEIDCEDLADVHLTFPGNVQATIQLDYLRRRYSRGCEVLTADSVQVWQHDLPLGADRMYRRELRHFLAMCRGEEPPACTLQDGVRALRLVEAARKSSETGTRIWL